MSDRPTVRPGRVLLLVTWIASLPFVTGCAATSGPEFGVYDEMEGFNRFSYRVTDALDRAVLVPVARGYQRVTPDPVERGISNFFENLVTVDSAVNAFLQGKPRAGITDLTRFFVNSTVGIAGFIDVATPAGLPYADEDLGQTFATWGWKRTGYVYLPMFGPSTWRDLPARIIRGQYPRAAFGRRYNIGISAVDVISTRAGLLTATDTRDASALDGYAFTRDAFYQTRRFDTFDGDPPLDEDSFDDFDSDEDF